MTSVLDALPSTDRERLDLSAALAAERIERAMEHNAVDSFTLMNALVWSSTKRGLYYANPAFLRFMFADWQHISIEKVQEHVDELIDWGEVVLHPGLAMNCYGGTHDILEIVDRRRFRRFQARRPIPKSIRLQVFSRDGWKCRHCGQGKNLSVDHIVPWSRGGAHDMENFQTLCRPCNSSKGAKV